MTFKRMVMLALVGMFTALTVSNYYDISHVMWWISVFVLNIICISLVDHLNGERYE